MAKVPKWENKLKDIISASQESSKSHERLIVELLKIYESTDKKAFAGEFLRLFLYPLTLTEKSSFANTCLSFFAKFAVCTAPEDSDGGSDSEEIENKQSDEGRYLFYALLNFVVSVLPSTNTTVRWRGCGFLEVLLTECSHQKRSDCLTDKIWDKLTGVLATRCRDKAVHVRMNAVGALAKLQQPTDPDCPAVRAISFLMRFDPNPAIRAHCIRLVSATKATIGYYVVRCRDVSEPVRRSVYSQIAGRNLFKYLTIEQRLEIITRGLMDPSAVVRSIFEGKILDSWLAAVDNDIPALIHRLDLVTSEQICEKILKTLFVRKPPGELVETFAAMTEQWETTEWITPERVFCLRHFVRFISQYQDVDPATMDDWMEKLLPPLYPLVSFIERYMLEQFDNGATDLVDGILLQKFIMGQLLELLEMVDQSDNAGRTRLQQLLDRLAGGGLPDADTSTVELGNE